MVAPKFRNRTLWVKAVDNADVRMIDETGRPLMDYRYVGKEVDQVMPEGARVPYHPHYVARLKEGTLLAMDIDTATLAGVLWSPALLS